MRPGVRTHALVEQAGRQADRQAGREAGTYQWRKAGRQTSIEA